MDPQHPQKALEGDFHEVVLTLSVTVKNGEENRLHRRSADRPHLLIKGWTPLP